MTAKDLVLHPRKAGGCFLHVYRILEGQLQLVHQTDIEDVPLAMCEFQGKLLVGVGKSLRLYDMGKRKLLKKCENKSFPVTIVRLQINGDRIYVGDMCESVHYVKYRRTDNMFSVFCDETVPRFITALTGKATSSHCIRFSFYPLISPSHSLHLFHPLIPSSHVTPCVVNMISTHLTKPFYEPKSP